jgi:uncharacterized damage-inducible protein DinB
MKELLQQYAAYNLWANQTLLELILRLPQQQQIAEVPSSFNSLQKTIVHLWNAEAVWWQRVKLVEKVIAPQEAFTGDLKTAASAVFEQDRKWLEWVQTSPERMFQHEFIYQNSKRETFKQPVFQVLLHVFNHSTYHRGQLVNILRQLGVQNLPATDFSAWGRK